MATTPKFRKVRQLTLPLLQLAQGQPRYLFLLGEMYIGEKVQKNKDAATLVHAIDMETGEEGIVICSSVMQSELLKGYGQKYVGKGFEIVQQRKSGKDGLTGYNIVTISEVAPPDDFAPPKVEAGPGAGRPTVREYVRLADRPEIPAAKKAA